MTSELTREIVSAVFGMLGLQLQEFQFKLSWHPKYLIWAFACLLLTWKTIPSNKVHERSATLECCWKLDLHSCGENKSFFRLVSSNTPKKTTWNKSNNLLADRYSHHKSNLSSLRPFSGVMFKLRSPSIKDNVSPKGIRNHHRFTLSPDDQETTLFKRNTFL